MALYVSLFFTCFFTIITSLDINRCNPIHPNNNLKTIESNADIYITALINGHKASYNGLYACGQISEKGVIIFEALKWLINMINSRNKTQPSLLPEIKLGIKVYDACEHHDLGVNYLTKIYPVLESGVESCEEDEYIDLSSIALLDTIDIFKDIQIIELSRKHNIPINMINFNSIISSTSISKLLTLIIEDLKWQQIALIYSSDEYSLQIIKLLGQASVKDRFCITFIQSLPSSNDSHGYISLLRSIILIVPSTIPILIIGPSSKIISVMSERIEIISKHQWLFTTIPEPHLLRPFLNSSVSFFTLSPFPGAITSFEQYWQELQLIHINSSSSNDWFNEYVNSKRKFDGSKYLDESQIDVLWRTYQLIPMIYTLFYIASSFHDAWNIKCNSFPGLCNNLRKMTRKEFQDFFKDTEPEKWLINDVFGRKALKFITSFKEKDDNLMMALTKLDFTHSLGISYNHLIAYDITNHKRHIIDSNVHYNTSKCPLVGGCTKCLKVRQSRADTLASQSSITWTFSRRYEPSLSSSHLLSSSPTTLTVINENECSKCTACWKQMPLIETFKINIVPIWTLLCLSLSGFGIFMIIVCIIYFLMVFPMRIGSTILGYMILIGLFVLHGVNFFYLSPISFINCWFRRFGMSSSYSMIISAMLIKVMNIWRVKKGKQSSNKLKLNSPSGLLSVFCFLLTLQIVVTLLWLFIIPPKPILFQGTWYCSLPTHFSSETESLVSLLYIILLLIITMFFCCLTWTCYDNNNEPKWIFLCCFSSISIWTSWALSDKYWVTFRSFGSLTIVTSNLFISAIIFLTLFVRKVILYHRLSKNRDSQQRLQSTSFSSYYGTVAKSSKKINVSFCDQHKGLFQENDKSKVTSIKLTATKPPFETDKEDGGSYCGSTSGSIQVQAEDLYPMEVYEGLSQIQAVANKKDATKDSNTS